MTTASQIMTKGCECVGEDESLQQAARKMRFLDVGSLPIRTGNGRLIGMLTDRDIVERAVAEGLDISTTPAGFLAQGPPLCVDVDASVSEVVNLMTSHQIRRVPVLMEHRLVGIISQADIARNVPDQAVGETVERISAESPGSRT